MTPSVGWGVLHLFYRVDRERAERDAGAAKRVLDAFAALEADGHQALALAMLGHKSDVGVIALGPDLARLQQFQHELLAAPLVPVYSYVSLTEQSEYGATEDEERARLQATKVSRATSSKPRSQCGASASRTTRRTAFIRSCR